MSTLSEDPIQWLDETAGTQETPVPDTTIFCVNCANATTIGVVEPLVGCGAPGIGHHDPVSGQMNARRAGEERADPNGQCGPTGKLFVAKA